VVNTLQGRRTSNEMVSKFHFHIREFLQWISEMASASLRFEDRLDGTSNFLSWKVRVTLLLEENDLWDIVKNVTNPQELIAHNK
jgi:hypothetical protein